ncbi:MAG: SDR family oxidoreductase [Dehalococcoidia bacterium]|nr:SDR family oxidoreductase [Dehalococcoidia bacterium]
MSLHGKVALVTGSGRNIGKEIALEMARQGAAVAVHARASGEEVEAVRQEIVAMGGKACAVLADVGSRAAAASIVRQVTEALGPVDILVNNVAIRPTQKALEIAPEDWERVMAVNLGGPFHLCQAVLPGMVQHRWGRIVNFSGRGAFEGAPNRAHVMAAKTAIVGLTRGLALEFAPQGITANCIVPGTFETERRKEWEMGEGRTLANMRLQGALSKPAPVGRQGRSEEVASLCAFLCSEDAAFITGQAIHVNGGAYVT